jgi:hypothetical protein
MRSAFSYKRSFLMLFLAIVLAGGAAIYWWYGGGGAALAAAGTTTYKTPQEADKYVRFDMEGYDLMQLEYWQKAGDSDFASLFQAAVEKVLGTSTVQLSSKNRTGVAEMLATVFNRLTNESKKKQVATDILTVALYNLPPSGRNQLLSQQAQKDLTNEVNHVDPNANLYGDLGLAQGASSSAVNAAYQMKTQELAATTSARGKAELAAAQHAHEVLSNSLNKAVYDQTGGQPTVKTAKIGAHTLYLGIAQIAPTTINEFVAAVASSSPSLDTMVLDLRGNIGGALDFTQYLLALFLGPNQYAYDLYHQGDLDVQRTAPITKMPDLARFKEIAVLTDQSTQSTAELTAEQLRHDHLAYVVGQTTRGWGTVEHVYPLSTEIDPNEQFAILIVQYVTLRDDGKPIQDNGVTPDVNITDANWKSALTNYFNSSDLINAIKSAIANPPK